MELAKRNLPSDMAGTLCLAFCFVNLSVSFCLVNLNSAQGKGNNSNVRFRSFYLYSDLGSCYVLTKSVTLACSCVKFVERMPNIRSSSSS